MAHIKIGPNIAHQAPADSFKFKEMIRKLILRTEELGTDAMEDLADLSSADGNIIVGNGTTWVAESGATARASLGLTIGSDVQAYNSNLLIIGFLDPEDNGVLIGDGSEWTVESGATLRTSLGLAIGTNVQAWDANLDQIAALAVTDGNFIVGDGSAWVAESGATARTSMGVGTGDSPLFTAVNIGATDTTVTRKAAAILEVEGYELPRINVGNSLGTKDNAILRADGTAGSLIQGQTSDLGPVINDDGSVVNTLQPAFLAYNSATDLNQTGNTTQATVDFDTEVFDQGGDFAADTFTAPVTGKYLLSASVVLQGITAANDGSFMLLVTSNRTYTLAVHLKNNFIFDSSWAMSGSAVVDMDANDTAIIKVASNGEASDVVDIYGSAAPETYFSGCLIA